MYLKWSQTTQSIKNIDKAKKNLLTKYIIFEWNIKLKDIKQEAFSILTKLFECEKIKQQQRKIVQRNLSLLESKKKKQIERKNLNSEHKNGKTKTFLCCVWFTKIIHHWADREIVFRAGNTKKMRCVYFFCLFFVFFFFLFDKRKKKMQ